MPASDTVSAARRPARSVPKKLDNLRPGERPWPRLSETLTGPRHPERCQNCGRWRLEIQRSGHLLQWWQECAQDEVHRLRTNRDVREGIYLAVCNGCNKENTGFLYKHPRFYRDLPSCSPTPGIMSLCIDCAWRDGTHCSNPADKHNGDTQLRTRGGEGLVIEHPEPVIFHLTCSPRSASGMQITYPSPPTACSGREEIEAAARFDDDLFSESDYLTGAEPK